MSAWLTVHHSLALTLSIHKNADNDECKSFNINIFIKILMLKSFGLRFSLKNEQFKIWTKSKKGCMLSFFVRQKSVECPTLIRARECPHFSLPTHSDRWYKLSPWEFYHTFNSQLLLPHKSNTNQAYLNILMPYLICIETMVFITENSLIWHHMMYCLVL